MWRPETRQAVRARGARVLLALLVAAWTAALFADRVVSPPLSAARRASGAQAPVELPPGDGAAIVRGRCMACHGPELIAQQRLDSDGWNRELDKMVGWGAVVEPAERDVLVHYLARHFAAALPEAGTDDAGPLLRARCSTCHDLTLIAQQRLDADGWARELDKMIGWGATLTEAEKAELASLLGRRSGKR